MTASQRQRPETILPQNEVSGGAAGSARRRPVPR
jgi:hypothetical protein